MNLQEIEKARELTSDPAGPYLTVAQFEALHPGLKNRMRGYIMRADIGLGDYAGLAEAIIRVGRSVVIDESAAIRWLRSRAGQPKSRGRNPHGRAGRR
jgi:hypothetical protein